MIERKEYPARYYASYDKETFVITGWFDTWDMSSVSNVPSADDMIVLTPDEWNDSNFRKSYGKGVQNGVIVDYTPPVVPVPLATQAQSAMSWVNEQASLASAMGETFTDDMKTYVKAIRAIISGTDTTSTELPTQPSDIIV